jgi:F0F1-type ATP synthase membrane subunit c/vacuolar-type H+-ATPase subunit K
MNKWMKIGMLALVAALAVTLAAGTTALAQPLEAGRGPGNGGNGTGGGGMGGPDSSLVAVAATTLGMARTDLAAELNTGKTIAAVAKERGVDPVKIVDAFLAIRAAALQEAVAEGRLTQAQADAMLENMRIQVTEQINTPFHPGGNGYGNGDGDGVCDGTGS